MADPNLTALETAFAMCMQDGVAPGDFAQRALELAHAAERRPCGEGKPGGKCRVTTVDEATGAIDQRVMGPDADYVLTVGPAFELAAQQRYGNGTTQITIKKSGRPS